MKGAGKENRRISYEDRLEPNIWKEDYSIRSYEIDIHGNASVASLFNFMQDAASNHAHALGVSVQQLLAENRTWVLSRLLMKFDAYPRWKDSIQVITWPSGVDSLFALRDFELKNQNGESFGAGFSAWLIIDSRTRRPVRITPFVDRLRPIVGKHMLADKLEKLPPVAAKESQQHFRVGYRDLDLNQHVNSVRYIEWALESVPNDVRNACILSSLEINFLAEAFLHDPVSAMCHAIENRNNTFFHRILKEDNGLEFARVTTSWQKCNAGDHPNLLPSLAAPGTAERDPKGEG